MDKLILNLIIVTSPLWFGPALEWTPSCTLGGLASQCVPKTPPVGYSWTGSETADRTPDKTRSSQETQQKVYAEPMLWTTLTDLEFLALYTQYFKQLYFSAIMYIIKYYSI